VNASAVTNTTGAFQATGLPAGKYGICVRDPTIPYLDTCRWGTRLGRQALTATAATDIGEIVLQKGVFMGVQVNDSNHLLAAQPAPSRSDLTTGVMTANGIFRPAGLTSTSATRRAYSMVVPVGRPLYLWVWSGDYGLSVNGAAVAAAGSKLPFQATAGVEQIFAITVTGRLTAQ
jgi:hypothetical protein